MAARTRRAGFYARFYAYELVMALLEESNEDVGISPLAEVNNFVLRLALNHEFVARSRSVKRGIRRIEAELAKERRTITSRRTARVGFYGASAGAASMSKSRDELAPHIAQAQEDVRARGMCGHLFDYPPTSTAADGRAALTMVQAATRVHARLALTERGSGFDGIRQMFKGAGIDPDEAFAAIKGWLGGVRSPLSREQHREVLAASTLAVLAGYEIGCSERGES